MIRICAIIALIIGIAEIANAQSLAQLQSAVNSLDRDPTMRSANWSITVMNAHTGEVLLGHNMHRSLATASTMKALTTASGLAILGPSFTFDTHLQYDGRISSDGILEGNVYIRGEGDPALGSDRFGDAFELNNLMYAWAQKIKAAGITQINGDIIGDASFFSTQLTPSKWAWEDMGNYYGAGACGLNINENLYRLDFQSPSATGASTKVLRTDPPMHGVLFINEVKAGRQGSGDNAYIFGSPYSTTRYVRGTIPPGRSAFSIKGSIPDPALFCARRLKAELIKCEVEIRGNPTTVRLEKLRERFLPARRNLLFTHKSPSLREIVYHTNMKSVNLFAEAIANRLAVKQGLEGSTAQAVEAIEDYWRARGINTRGMYLRDGSGLSSNNVMSTFQLTSILCKVFQSSYFKAFDASLPVAGRSGSLKSMLKGTVAAGRLRAKSGYISGVRAYTGYVNTVGGHTLAFTMIVNHYSGSTTQMRRKFETLMVKLAAGN